MEMQVPPLDFVASQDSVTEIAAPAGTIICHAGDVCQQLIILREGRVRVYHPANDGRSTTLYHVGGNESCILTASVDAVEYCADLDFAGHDDWRVPTSVEMADMIVNADRLDVQLNYRNPNCQFMATSDGFVQTENNVNLGAFETSAVNSGARCMREN